MTTDGTPQTSKNETRLRLARVIAFVLVSFALEHYVFHGVLEVRDERLGLLGGLYQRVRSGAMVSPRSISLISKATTTLAAVIG